jgi:multimeric flavodoxin WrbA
MKILGIAASKRKNGNTAVLVETALEAARNQLFDKRKNKLYTQETGTCNI